LAEAIAGNSMLAKIAMMAITTSNSIKVKARASTATIRNICGPGFLFTIAFPKFDGT
jgi:hypothetical protein